MAIERTDGCIGCGTCVKTCPTDVFRLDRKAKKAVIQYPGDCQICHLCRMYCPVDASRSRQVDSAPETRFRPIGLSFGERDTQYPSNLNHPSRTVGLGAYFGTTMTTFITQHRISHAQRLLVTTDDAILDVALAAGFQSLSRFNEAFKAACGCSPRDYRKVHRATQNLDGFRGDA